MQQEGQIPRLSGFPKPLPTHRLRRVRSATSFYAAFRPLFRLDRRWPASIPFDQRSLRQPGGSPSPRTSHETARLVRLLDVDEDHKRVPLIADSILAARKLAQFAASAGWSPAHKYTLSKA